MKVILEIIQLDSALHSRESEAGCMTNFFNASILKTCGPFSKKSAITDEAKDTL